MGQFTNQNLSLTQNLSQKLALTPELLQTIKVLQLNTFELASFINEELLSNPLLEVIDKVETEKVYDRLSHRLSVGRNEDDDDYNYEETVKSEQSLFDFLHQQFGLIKGLSKDQRKIGDYIIDSLDDSGYRTERATEIAAKLGFSHDEVLNVIHIIQSLEPAGVAAKSLQECLALQLKRNEEYNEIFECLIYKHLNDLAHNRMSVIAKDCGISCDEMQEYCDMIRSLDPKPGKRFGQGEQNKYTVPDCFLEEIDGHYVVYNNMDDIPQLQLSPYLSSLKNEAAGDEKALAYLKEKFNSAQWLIKGINQRNKTILSIAQAIVDYQKDFFDKGPLFLKPMTLKDISETVRMHESTVSRTVNGKYIQTTRGCFELKYFFGGKTNLISGDEVASSNVKQFIKEIVDGEDPKHPLSDEKIKDELMRLHGISIARRTVAKYRDQLGILGTSQRKRY